MLENELCERRSTVRFAYIFAALYSVLVISCLNLTLLDD